MFSWPQGINKATGVKKLLAHMKLEGSQMMALGDGENDKHMLEMAAVRRACLIAVPGMLASSNCQTLRWHHDRAHMTARGAYKARGASDHAAPLLQIGVAMGNGSDSLKEVATWVSPSNDEDGFAAAINKLLQGGF